MSDCLAQAGVWVYLWETVLTVDRGGKARLECGPRYPVRWALRRGRVENAS